jgi:hypothetical protein
VHTREAVRAVDLSYDTLNKNARLLCIKCMLEDEFKRGRGNAVLLEDIETAADFIITGWPDRYLFGDALNFM